MDEQRRPPVDDLDELRFETLTYENAPLLAALFKERDVWRNFGYEAEPSAFAVRFRFRQGDMTGLLVRRPSVDRYVAFVLGFGTPGPEGELEYAIAVPDPAERKKGVGKRVGMISTGWFFENNLCKRLWAWGDAKNTAMLALVQSCGWEVCGFEASGREMVDGHADTVAVQMTRDRWLALRAARA